MKRIIKWTPLLCALPCALTGTAVMRMQGVYAQNLPVLIVGGLLTAWALARGVRMTERGAAVGAALCVAAMAAVFAFPGAPGVHRWMRVGPLNVHTAFIALPVLLMCMEKSRPIVACAAALAASALLCLQPDASMATALAVAAWADGVGRRGARRMALPALLSVLAALAWMRRDGLAPVAHVEGVVQLAASCGWGWALLSVLSLLCLLLPFAWGARRGNRRAVGLGLLFLTLIVCGVGGKSPVPVLGSGLSPVVGYLIAAGGAVSGIKREGTA